MGGDGDGGISGRSYEEQRDEYDQNLLSACM